jgi:hypothetical protein
MQRDLLRYRQRCPCRGPRVLEQGGDGSYPCSREAWPGVAGRRSWIRDDRSPRRGSCGQRASGGTRRYHQIPPQRSSFAMRRTPNQPDAVNPAIAPWFQVGRQWRGVTDPHRSAETPERPRCSSVNEHAQIHADYQGGSGDLVHRLGLRGNRAILCSRTQRLSNHALPLPPSLHRRSQAIMGSRARQNDERHPNLGRYSSLPFKREKNTQMPAGWRLHPWAVG